MKCSVPGAAAVVEISQRLAAVCFHLAKDKFGSKVIHTTSHQKGVNTLIQGVMHPFDLRGAASHFSTAHKPSSHPSSTFKAWSWAQGKLLFNRIKVDEESFPRIWSRW